MKKLAVVVVAMGLLAGCGTPGGLVASDLGSSQNATLIASTSKKVAGFDKQAFESGLSAGMSKAKTIYRTQNTNNVSYDYGYAVGLIQGSLNSFARINGSFNVSEWRSLTYMNRKAMEDALNALQKNPELASKQAVAIGMLQGGISSFDSISGTFGTAQWKAFAYSNERVLKNVLAELTK